MKTKAILFSILLLAGCQQSENIKPNLSAITPISTKGTSTSHQPQYDVKTNLWGYVVSELKMDLPENERISQQELYFLNNPKHIQSVAARAEPYMYSIIDEIEKRELPMELALVPVVESAFNPHVTSSANAAGLWQFVPITGNYYGLAQNQWYDGRRDVMASTKAALDLLERLYVMFDSDWALALAAYNAGEGRVMQAIKANESQNLPTDYWSLSLPKETMNYVPKILALSKVIRENEENITFPKSNYRDKALASFDVGEQITLNKVAELSQLPINTVKDYNPGYKRGITAPNGPHVIMLPRNKLDQFRNAFEDEAVLETIRLAVAKTNQSIKQEGVYKVRSGDSFYAIARRYNMSIKDLQRINGLNAKSTLLVGQTLKIHNAGSVSSTTTTKPTKPSPSYYKVRQGDSYYSIARRHGINLKQLMSWNADIKMLKPGTQLTLYVK
ncbi:murein transglycosylase D [Proteus sp. GOKU]|uniref:murein transglycosylase D n=1 Tax=Proteus TaxID=583 RepID=UPI000B4DEFEF|nr:MULTISPECIES: murein transglycosylase D [Proteus]MDY3693860.1 murein transglycosylase D [Proteus mirabilis]PNL48232.1 murein transglycosylase D [Proteus mirabilis]QPB78650.1 murein transglycosylase D [Proteus sp. GOKU]QQP24657.1 murein transglycosylase D [Proteus vulgaris]